MKAKAREILAVGAVIFALTAVPLWIWWYENNYFGRRYGVDAKIFKLTASCRQGRVTVDRVAGHNYWSGKFRRLDKITVNKGDKVVLVVKSADATHSFSVKPELNVEQPIEMEGGHTKVVDFIADKPGSYLVECTSFCCVSHHGVFFKIEVLDKPSKDNLSMAENK